MEPCTPYQNHHHHSTVVTGSQQGRTCWPYRVKLMSNIKCDIIVWTPKFMKVEKILFDEALWLNEMLPKLCDFYYKYMLPLIVY